MQKTISIKAKSKEEAISKAMKDFNLEKDNIEVKEIEAPSGGFLGLFSKEGSYELILSTDAIVSSDEKKSVAEEVKESPAFEAAPSNGVDDKQEEDHAKEFVANLLKKSGISATVEVSRDNDIIKVQVKGKEASALIGRRGETLDSIQFLTGLALNKIKKDSRSRVLVDIENYRSKREESLKRYAYKAAKDVARTRRTKKLDYMNPYERRIVHSALQNDKFVITYSEGNDPYRRVVIEHKKKKNRQNA